MVDGTEVRDSIVMHMAAEIASFLCQGKLPQANVGRHRPRLGTSSSLGASGAQKAIEFTIILHLVTTTDGAAV